MDHPKVTFGEMKSAARAKNKHTAQESALVLKLKAAPKKAAPEEASRRQLLL